MATLLASGMELFALTERLQKRFERLSPVTVTSQIEIVTSVDIP